MRAKEFIIERNYSGPLYHMTRMDTLHIIMHDGLKFGHVYRDIKNHTIKDYKYVLSTSRTLTNTYTKTRKYDVSLVLNAAYFNQKDFIIKPVNFYSNMYHYEQNKKTNESEERIWSKEQYHPISCISEIHIQINIRFFDNDIFPLMESIIDSGINYYIYYEVKDFMLHNKRKSMTFEETKDELHLNPKLNIPSQKGIRK